MLGLISIAASYFLLDSFHTTIIEKRKNGEITSRESTIYEFLNGSLNGLIVVILNAIYGWIVTKMVDWENHK